jgi:hypothetical protein
MPRVYNEADRDAAEDVEILLLEIRNRATGAPLPFEMRPLAWAGADASHLVIPPGMYRQVGLFALGASKPLPPEGAAGFRLEPRIRQELMPGGGRHLMPVGEYTMRIAATARNAVRAVEYEFNIKYDGTWWSDGKIWEHVRVEELRQVQRRGSLRRLFTSGSPEP